MALSAALGIPFMAAAPTTPAAPTDYAISLDQALAMALDASQDRYTAMLAAQAARRDLDSAWNLFLPSIMPRYSAKLSDALFFAPAAPRAASADPFSTSFSFGASLSLATGVIFDLEKRRNDAASAELARLESEARLRRDTAKTYFLLVSLDQDIENKSKAADLAAERSRVASTRYERGLGSELDALRASMAERSAASAYEKAVADRRKRAAAFGRLLGLPPGATIRLTTPLPALGLPPHGLDERLLENRLDLQRTRLSMAAASTATRRYFAVNRLPLVTLDAGWSVSATDKVEPRDAVSASATISFNADAWVPNSRRDLELRSLRETEARLARKYEQDLVAARGEVEALLIDLELARASLGVAEGQLGLAERIHARASEAYERGASTLLELEDARLSLDGARQSLVTARYQYLVAAIDLDYALGRDWRDGLVSSQ